MINLELRYAQNVARMGEKRNEYRILMRKLLGKQPLGRPWRRWQDNINMDLYASKIGGWKMWELVQDRVQ